MTTACVRCQRPMPDQVYVCAEEARELGAALAVAAGHAEDAQSGAARGAQTGGGRGGSGEPLLFDATRSRRLASITNAVTTWVNDARDSGIHVSAWRPVAGPACSIGVRCPHSSCAATRVRNPPSALAWEFQWLSGQMSWLRKHPAADEAFAELHAACEDLARLVDRPPDNDLVGMCDCGKVLYAPHGKAFVTCPVLTCKLRWDVAESREILREALDDKLVTATEAARLGQYLDADRTQDNIRKLIDSRVRSGQLLAHGEAEVEVEVDGEARTEPTYRFGEVVLMLATVPRRQRRERAA